MDEDKINENEILKKLDSLYKKQSQFEKEIADLRKEVERMKQSVSLKQELVADGSEEEKVQARESVVEMFHTSSSLNLQAKPSVTTAFQSATDYTSFEAQKKAYYAQQQAQKTQHSFEIEKFIGENLINKIGILITIIGVGIGTKYAIDHQLISPLTRILLGYLVGVILFGFALRLKKNYGSFSAVLMSGSMAITYFITYAAYTFFALMPQYMAFGLMVLITVFTVYAAIKYDQQVIAHIGMVGAYGVPFLLSDGSGNILVLFTYMSIINLGIMVLAFQKYWKPLYYVSFALSWIIYLTWYSTSYIDGAHFQHAFLFLSVFYLIFYVTYLSYNLIRKEKFNMQDVLLILANSFFFYGIGYTMLQQHQAGEQYLGFFTLINALIHGGVCGIIYKMKLSEWHLFYFISALALVFLTITIPVELSGIWITLLWVGEAGLLFWVGRIKQISVYERISYGVMFFATFSLFGDWDKGYSFYRIVNEHLYIQPIANIYFMTSLLFVAVFAFINLLNKNEEYPSALDQKRLLFKMMQFILPAILLIACYFMFWFEVSSFWNSQIGAISGTVINGAMDVTNQKQYSDLSDFRILWLINYSLLFFVILSVLNIKILKNRTVGYINLGVNLILLVVFLTQGLYSLSELRDSFLNQTARDLYHSDVFNFYFRYICYLFVLPILVVCYRYVKQDFVDTTLDKVYGLILHIAILWVLSSELITWVDFTRGEQAYKLGLSLLWGGYALLLIALGIWRRQQHIRIGAIVLFGTTLLKLFFFDLEGMGTIARTIIFVTLGILLLIISFLYNKYKHILWDDSSK